MHTFTRRLARAAAAGVLVGLLVQPGPAAASDEEPRGSGAGAEAPRREGGDADGPEAPGRTAQAVEPEGASPAEREAAREEREGEEPLLSLEDMPEIPPPTAGVEEITVTATRREESLQDVPVSITALDASFLKDSGLTQFKEIQKFVPNLQIIGGTDTRSTSIRIRGIGSVGTNAGIDPSVGLFIDGIYQGRAGMSMNDLLDIERVEVLRGPQGTLYGKNTAAGLIHVITKRPSYEYEVFAEGIFASYDQFDGRTSVNVPIVDGSVATRMSMYRAVRGGWDKNIFDGEDVNDADKWGLRNQWLFDFHESVSLLVSGDYSKEKTDCCVADIITYEGDSLLWGGGNPPRPQVAQYNQNRNFAKLDGFFNERLPTDSPFRTDGNLTGRYIAPEDAKPELRNFNTFDERVDVDADPKNEVQIWGVHADLELALPYDLRLNWLSAYRSFDTDSRFDGDFSQYDAVLAFNDEELQQVSSELRLVSPTGGLLDYTAGFYFYWQDHDTLGRLGYEQDFADIFIRTQNRDDPPNSLAYQPVNNVDQANWQTYSYAGYGQLNLNLGEWARLTGGIRYTHERKTREGSQICNSILNAPPVCGPDIIQDDERTANNVSGLASLQLFPMDDVMVYASFATGFKSGGFNQLRTAQEVDPEFDDEEAFSYELGLRSSWFDRMLTFNLTGYFTDYDDFQAQSFTGTSITIRNAGSFYSAGFESDLVVVPLPELIWRTAIGFNWTEYQDFDEAENTVENIVAIARDSPFVDNDGNVVPAALAPLAFGTNCDARPERFPEGCSIAQDLEGKRLDNAPRWTISSNVQYEVPVFSLPFRWTFRTDFSFRSSLYLTQDLDSNLKEDPVSLLDFRTGLRADPGEGLVDGQVGWELIFWVTNVLDQHYNVSGFDVPVLSGFAGIRGPPRQFGGTVRLTY